VEHSVKVLQQKERSHGRYKSKAILLDADKIGISPDRDNLIGGIVKKNGFSILFQNFDHEAILLRHFPKCLTHRPPRGGLSLKNLRKVWPEYEKPADALDISKRISLTDFVRFLGVEPEFKAFFDPHIT
jgi:hypothetical protein